METSSTSVNPWRLVRPVSSSWKARYELLLGFFPFGDILSIIVTAGTPGCRQRRAGARPRRAPTGAARPFGKRRSCSYMSRVPAIISRNCSSFIADSAGRLPFGRTSIDYLDAVAEHPVRRQGSSRNCRRGHQRDADGRAFVDRLKASERLDLLRFNSDSVAWLIAEERAVGACSALFDVVLRERVRGPRHHDQLTDRRLAFDGAERRHPSAFPSPWPGGPLGVRMLRVIEEYRIGCADASSLAVYPRAASS